MSTVFALVAAYFGALFALSLLVRPKRERFASLAKQLLSEDIPEQQTVLIESLIDSAYRLRAAPSQLLGLVIALLTPSSRLDADAHEWAKKNAEIICDRRWSELFDCHTASIAAANPLVGVFLYLARGLFTIKVWIFFKRSLERTLPKRYADFERAAVDTRARLRAAA